VSKSKKIILGIIIACITAVVFATVSYYSYVYYSYKKTSYVEEKEQNLNNDNENHKDINNSNKKVDNNNENDKKESNKNNNKEELKYKEVEGITNILLVGTDARDYTKRSRADTIMILTIDDIHKKIKLTSIMRDTYVSIPGHGEQKINHSFAYGKAALLMKTIESNFNIKLDKYAVINFFGFKDLVDTIGGLDINVSETERKELNRCIIGLENYKKDFFGEKPNYLKKSGLQHLDGQQVLAYARMRHIERGCYSRDERQRKVVNMIAKKLKNISILKYPEVLSKLFPCVKTNIEFTEALNLGYTIYKIGDLNIKQLQVPATKLSYGMIYKNKGWVLLIDKTQNINMIHNFIFKDIPYDASKYKMFSYVKSKYYYKPQIKDNRKKISTKISDSITDNASDESIIKDTKKNDKKDNEIRNINKPDNKPHNKTDNKNDEKINNKDKNDTVFDLDDKEFYTNGVQNNSDTNNGNELINDKKNTQDTKNPD